MPANYKTNRNDKWLITKVDPLQPDPITLKSDFYIEVQTGTTYTLTANDFMGTISLNNGSTVTVTVPPNSSVKFPVGTQVDLIQLGVGQVVVSPGAGVTINATPGLKIAARYTTATLIQVATNSWVLVGNLTA